ncbi:hypothetical protein PF002_g8885 [Phytophthora fragariae]|uniref:Uncharacterized protein n=1 Tax=Phytophthora fragariae TaxID=53985 RepID=A0A6A3SNB8_9STRA|nr:hypothetical protein PF007_g8042 [Phytophthora fragariae]KAE9242183.1 hypothetical protein PF002_g8885 [Phytophthora fragariae]
MSPRLSDALRFWGGREGEDRAGRLNSLPVLLCREKLRKHQNLRKPTLTILNPVEGSALAHEQYREVRGLLFQHSPF